MTATMSDPLPARRAPGALRLAPAGSPPLHGRATEWQTVGELLRRAERGRGGVLLVDGERGIGKSLLLRECEREATARGFSLADATADRLGQAIPLFTLLTALRQPFGMDASPSRAGTESIASQIAELARRLQQRTAAAPLLVSLDELQWASQATLAALRILPAQLARYPLAWILARSDDPRDQGGELLFRALECAGARRLTLRPLGDEAVTAVLTESFGAPPDERLLSLAAGAGGNPTLLTELTGGLRDDAAVRVVDGRACLVSADLPSRIHAVARQRLDGLSRRAQHVLKTAAVLGGSFRLADLAEMLGDTPAGLLPAVEEALAAGLVMVDDTAFSFRHSLLRCAAAAMVPGPARRALHRQFGELLVHRGESGAAAAGHLLEAACTGDPASLAGLDKAAAELLTSSPRVAASLAVRALDLTPSGDPGTLARSVTAAEALTAAGRFDDAGRIARDALARPLLPVAEGRLRCALSAILCANGHLDQARDEAEAVLALPELPPDLRDEALTAQLHALAGLGEDQAAERVAAPVLAAPGQHGSQAVTAALVTRATSAWDGGRISDGLQLLREAARHGRAVSPDARHDQPLLALAAALADLGQEKEAGEVLRAIDRETLEGIPAQAVLAVLEARRCLGEGSLSGAEAAARAALAAAGPARGHARLARCVLGLIALRGGDVKAASRHLAGCPAPVPRPVASFARFAAAMTHARVIEISEGPAAAIGHVRAQWADLSENPGLLLGEPATPAWLIRTAVAAGDHDLAGTVAQAAAALARDNPGIPAVAAAAAHGLGLVGRDPALLAQAAKEHAGPWAQASAAEDLGVLLTEADKDGAIAHLTSALDRYRQAGAASDMARVRGRLRALGVRRRHWRSAPGRPVTGWDSLTEAEHATAELAAQGLNNKQIAGRLYISKHTVAFHLRQIFLKLHIGSRVELTRIVIEHAGPALT